MIDFVELESNMQISSKHSIINVIIIIRLRFTEIWWNLGTVNKTKWIFAYGSEQIFADRKLYKADRISLFFFLALGLDLGIEDDDKDVFGDYWPILITVLVNG